MFYNEGLVFDLARNPHYKKYYQFVDVNKIDGYVSLRYNKLRKTLLKKDINYVEGLLVPLKLTLKGKRLKIVSDGCGLF